MSPLERYQPSRGVATESRCPRGGAYPNRESGAGPANLSDTRKTGTEVATGTTTPIRPRCLRLPEPLATAPPTRSCPLVSIWPTTPSSTFSLPAAPIMHGQAASLRLRTGVDDGCLVTVVCAAVTASPCRIYSDDLFLWIYCKMFFKGGYTQYNILPWSLGCRWESGPT